MFNLTPLEVSCQKVALIDGNGLQRAISKSHQLRHRPRKPYPKRLWGEVNPFEL